MGGAAAAPDAAPSAPRRKVVPPLEIEHLGRKAFEKDRERLVEAIPLLGHVEPVEAELDRRHAAPDAKLEAAVRQRIEHRHFLDQPQRVVDRQQVDQRAEAQAFGALAQRGEQDPGRRREDQRRAVVLGDVVTMKAMRIVSLGHPEPRLEVLGERQAAVVDVVEHPEFHEPDLPEQRRSA